MISIETFENTVNAACAELYATKKHYIDERAHERTIVADFIAPFLRERLKGWDVNTDYNREGVDREPKKDLDGNLIMPDIIVHKHGPAGPNLFAVQVKGYWNRQDRVIDEDSLRRIRAKHGYRFLYRLELGRDKHEIIPVF